ncbi:MAG: hypothetical protein GY772_23170, partial [bacterium]|nr:hypothetical protein [bacterium]
MLVALFGSEIVAAETLAPSVSPTLPYGTDVPVGAAADLPALLDLGDVAGVGFASVAHGSAGNLPVIADATGIVIGDPGGSSGQRQLADRRAVLALHDVEGRTWAEPELAIVAPAVMTVERMMQRQIAELQQQLAETALTAQHMRAGRDSAQRQAVEEQELAVAMLNEARLAQVDAATSRNQVATVSQYAQAAHSQFGQAEQQAAALRQAAQRDNAQAQACVQQLHADEQQRLSVAHAGMRAEEEVVAQLRASIVHAETLARDTVQEMRVRMQHELG